MRVIRNATLADGRVRDVRLDDGGRIDAVAPELDGDGWIDAAERRLLPGVVDTHVHFREPGFSHKETWATGSRSAAAGGVTTVVDQPNTDPATTDAASFDEKERYASDCLVDYGINGGVTEEWEPDSLFERPIFALGEVFLADSTGDMGIDMALFSDALERAADEDVVVTVHAEDATLFDESVLPRSTEQASGAEPRAGARERNDVDAWSAYRTPEAEAEAVARAVDAGQDADARVHIAHTSTPEGIDAAKAGGATCEVTPHHAFLSRDDLSELGTFGRMNPPLRSEERRQAVFERLVDGTVDIIATDHAPHTREEKDASVWNAPSGMPGVETNLPLLLAAVDDGELTWSRVRDLTAANPARIFDLPSKGRVEAGRDADLVLVDPENRTPIRADDLHTKCDWTPYEGRDGVFPTLTLVRGEIVYDARGDEETFGDGTGQNVRR